uniref:Secreted protein n=1 Tax=Caenorhabditis japonica TaxID=281687 RepID=A0A8R1IX46_CAEJA
MTAFCAFFAVYVLFVYRSDSAVISNRKDNGTRIEKIHTESFIRFRYILEPNETVARYEPIGEFFHQSR